MAITRTAAPSKVALISMTLALAGCGGGGSSAGPEAAEQAVPAAAETPPGEEPGNLGALPTGSASLQAGVVYADLSARAAEGYTGMTEPASMSLESSGAIVDLVLFGSARHTTHRGLRVDDAPILSLKLNDGPLKRVIASVMLHADVPVEVARDGIASYAEADPLQPAYDPYNPFAEATPGTGENCESGTSTIVDADIVTLPDGTTRWERTVEFDRCVRTEDNGYTLETTTYDGSLRWTVESVDGVPTGTWIGYDGLSVQRGETTHRVNGVEALPHAAQCSLGKPRSLDLLIENETTGESILFDDMRTAMLGVAPEHCAGIRREANWFDGRILHSSRGAFEIATPTHVAHLGDGSGRDDSFFYSSVPVSATPDPDAPGGTLGGEVVFSGVDDSMLTAIFQQFSTRPSEGAERYGDAGSVETVVLRLGDGEVDGSSIRLSRDDAELGVMRALGDTDGDGLPDGWERLRALDADDASDAMKALYGGSALHLFAASASPLDESRQVPQPHDDEIRLSLRDERYDGWSDAATAQLVVEVHSDGITETIDGRYAIQLEGAVSFRDGWDGVPYNCAVTDPARQRADCVVEEDWWQDEGGARFSSSLGLIASDGGDFVATATLESGALDSDATNDQASLAGVLRGPVPTLELRIPAVAVGTASEARTLEATLKVVTPAPSLDATFEIAIPDGVLVEAATLTSDGAQAIRDRCTVGQLVICDMDALKHSDTATLELEFRLSTQGDVELDWTVTTSDPRIALDAETTRMLQANPVSELQALVDAAVDGDTIDLPAGRFVGTLNGRAKRLHLRGAESDGGTLIITDDTFNSALTGPGTGSLIDGVRFQITGPGIWAPSAGSLAVVGSTFEPLEDSRHLMKRLIEGQGRLRFEGNLVRGFGARHGGDCRRLIVSNSQNGQHYAGNRFIDNDCGAVMSIAGDGWYHDQIDQRLDVLGNTFVGNDILFALDGYGLEYPVLFANNLVVETETLFGNPNRAEYLFRQDGGFTTDTNLLFSSERESILSGAMAANARLGYVNLDVSYDPMFVDAPNGDFRLSPVSPAIDAGVDVPVWAEGGGTQTFAYTSATAVDGNGDGDAQRDIGAFEYRP